MFYPDIQYHLSKPSARHQLTEQQRLGNAYLPEQGHRNWYTHFAAWLNRVIRRRASDNRHITPRRRTA